MLVKERTIELEEIKTRFRETAERTFNMIITLDPEGRIKRVSSSMERFLGYNPQEVIGKPFQSLLPESEVSTIAKTFNHVMSGNSQLIQLRILRRDKPITFVEVVFCQVMRKGKTVEIQGIARDITGQKELESKMRETAFRLNDVSSGGCYLSKSNEQCFKVFRDLYTHGVRGLCIVREDPEALVRDYGLKPKDLLVLSPRPLKGFQTVYDLQEISLSISNFLRVGGGVVLLSGLEYLVNRFDFNSVCKLLQEKRFEFLEAGAVLLVCVNLETLYLQEKALLLSELNLLDKESLIY